MTTHAGATPRFLTPAEAAAELGVRPAQLYALLRSGDLPAIKVGGRGQWRIERAALEDWIAARYAGTRAWVAEHPLHPRACEPGPGIH